MQRQLEEVQANKKKHYAEQVDREQYDIMPLEKKPQRFVIADDDAEFQPKMWASAMKDAAYYFDNPTLAQEKKMKQTLQAKYDPLFKEGWMPPMQSRNDLVSWVCQQQNAYMADRDAADKQWNCENPSALVQQFGPNYDVVKAKLGYVRGLQRDWI